MKNLKQIIAVSVFVALLAVAGSFAQQQGPQSLTTTTLSNSITAVGAGSTSQVTLASIANVYATVSVGTTLWVDTEAMDVVTNSILANTTTLMVQRGSHGTKAEGHASGRTVYVSRPNLYQGYDVAGTCWTNSAGTSLPTILPWINITSGARFNCYSDGNWFKEGYGSSAYATTAVSAFCTGIPAESTTVYLNGATCTGATTATYAYTVTTAGELANLRIHGSAVAANANVFTVYKNGTATAITCTVAIAAQTCSDNTHSVATVNGDYIQIQDAVGSTGAETFANASATVGLYGQ
jgi:hypothetical protein